MNFEQNGLEIAIIGMSGRFPAAKNIDEFWECLKNGKELITVFSELEQQGILANGSGQNNKIIKVGAILDDVEMFDASFFGFSPKEAETMDPQHRLFLECAWEALENAGYDCQTEEKLIGVYASVGLSTYLLYNIYPNQELMESRGFLQTEIGVDKDYIATRVSYKLNLKGPSVTVQTACSSSLVAVHFACQSLLNGECDMALAAGVSIKVPQNELTLSPDAIVSPDGHCRAFDAKANGTVGGNGVGVVVLKRLKDAIADNDRIYAVIKGSAINNDGSLKIGYTAPSQDGQARVIRTAQAMAEVEPETITYMEAHGTGTPLGDPIEIAAMTQAFRCSTDKNGYCAIGSVKTNIGHLNPAAGIAGLIKTVLALQHKSIPPSLNFEIPNSQIDFDNSPFYVNNKLSEWKVNNIPRRAGVSSFGIGGTNAHVILEEAPALETSSNRSRSQQLLVLSAKTPSALETATTNLANYLRQHPDINLPDVAYTLQVGRQAFNHRRMVIAKDIEDAVKALASTTDEAYPQEFQQRVYTQFQESSDRPVVFMFTGQGAQYVNMTREIYQSEPTFREECDRCCELLKPHLGLDLRCCLYPKNEETEKAAQQLQQTAITQPALFVIEYALAKLWMSWGVHPTAMIGHSIGEYVAATLAGVFSLEDALSLVVARGQLMQQLPSGKMLSIPLSEKDVQPLLGNQLSLAAINGPSLCVVSGCTDAVDVLHNQLSSQGVECRLLHTSHAFHSEMMEPILAPFTLAVKKVSLKPPQIPYVSNVTGTWIIATEATDSSYWTRHLRQTVRFAEGLQKFLQEPAQILLEVGPGRTLSTLAKRHSDRKAEQVVLSSVRHPQQKQSDVAFLLDTLGQLWLSGVKVDWSQFYSHERRHRIPLPTYPFERQRYWIEPPTSTAQASSSTTLSVPATLTATSKQKDVQKTPQVSLDKIPDITNWFYIPSWKRSMPPKPFQSKARSNQSESYLVFIDECGLGDQIVKRLKLEGQDVITVRVGEQFASINQSSTKGFSQHQYTINPQQKDNYDTLLKELVAQDKLPKKIVHLWSVIPNTDTELGLAEVDKIQSLGFYSLLYIAQVLGNLTNKFQITVVSNNLQPVTGEEILCPQKATLLGPVRVIPLEYPNILCRSIDVVLASLGSWQEEKLIEQLVTEFSAHTSDTIIAYRNVHRWVQTFEPVPLERTAEETLRLKEWGVYLITGGLGAIGLALAFYLAKTVRAKLILTGRSDFPAKDDWSQWLVSHDEDDEVSHKIRKVQELEELGSEVLVASANVADLEQLQAAIAQAQAQFGQLNGVIHAAGVLGDSAIWRKTPQQVESVLEPKVRGTLVLNALLKNVQLDFFVLCSSLSSIQPQFGQVAYAGANNFLDAFASYQTSTDGNFTVSINWDAWQEGGMSVKAGKQLASSRKIAPPQSKPVTHPLFDQRLVEGSQQEIYVSKFSVNKHWVLNEHRVMGKAMLPGTAYLELAISACEEHFHKGTLEIREVIFLAPLIVEEDEEKEVRTLLKKQGDRFEFLIMSQLQPGSNQWQEHTKGEFTFIEAEVHEKYIIQEIESICNEQERIITEQELKIQSELIKLGARWSSLKWIKFGENQGLAFLELPKEFTDDLEIYKLHPALLDVATGFLTFKFQDEDTYLPFSYKKLKFYKPLPNKIYSYIQATENNQFQKETLKFNITIMDAWGTALVDIEEYTLRKVNQEKADYTTAKQSGVLSKKAPVVSESEDKVSPEVKEKEWILTAEGIEVFSRILESSMSQVVVSTRNLVARANWNNTYNELISLEVSDKANQSKSIQPTHPRPELNNAYIAPTNESEQIVVAIWQEILGIKQIGINDNFFELDGDSLLAVQVIHKIREKFQVELPTSLLFEKPTVADITEYIENFCKTVKQVQASASAHLNDREEIEL